MSKEKKTEDLIKEKLDNLEFAFDEKAWAGMETLLDAQEKRKKRGFFWYFSAAMLVGLVAGGTYYFSQKSDIGGRMSEVKNEKLEVGNITLEVEDVSKSQNIQKIDVGEEIGQKTANSDDFNQKQENIKLNNDVSTHSKASNSIEKVLPTAKTGRQIVAAGTPAAETGTPAATVGEQTLVARTPAMGIGTPAATVGEQIVTAGTPAAEIGTPAATNGTPLVKEGIPFLASGNDIKAVDSAKTAEETSEIEKPNPLAAPGKENKNAWGVVAGMSAWRPYRTVYGVEDKKGLFGFTGGVFYQRILSKRFDLGLSAVYSSRGALNFDKTFINSDYGFGVQSDKTIVSPKTLHYLNVPLYIRFNISQRSHLLLGASYYQLLAITSKIEHITENSFGVLESNTEKQTGEHKGFRKNDLSAFIGYEFTLFDRMNAGLQFSYGFYDNTIDSYYDDLDIPIKNYDRNISLQLQLKYDLIKH